jgi:hypothetical protein
MIKGDPGPGEAVVPTTVLMSLRAEPGGAMARSSASPAPPANMRDQVGRAELNRANRNRGHALEHIHQNDGKHQHDLPDAMEDCVSVARYLLQFDAALTNRGL